MKCKKVQKHNSLLWLYNFLDNKGMVAKEESEIKMTGQKDAYAQCTKTEQTIWD